MPYSELHKVDFDQVIETSVDTVRKSVDGTKTFIKYIGDMPTSIEAIENKSQEYSHDEILDILTTEEWVESTFVA